MNMIQDKIKEAIQKAFKDAFAWQPDDIEITNPEPQFGDFALACHVFARQLKISPQDIANKLAKTIKGELVIKAQAQVGYLNLTIDSAQLAQAVLATIIERGKGYGSTKSKKNKVFIEYSSPNTNKPLHLGHMRNNFLGMAIANILASQGHEVVKTAIINDRGIHIAKAMAAYQNWGNNETPTQAGEKGDHFVGKFYIMFDKEFQRQWQAWLKKNPEVPGLPDEAKSKREQEFFGQSKIGGQAQQMLQKWEAGDKETRKLWQTMNDWVYDGFTETYKSLGSEFDKDYYESDTYLLGKSMVEQGLKDRVFVKAEDNSVWVDLSEDGLDKKILQRRDGTSVYITQDLGLAVTRQKELGAQAGVYVVGHEQEYHFKVLFKILEKMGYDWARNLYHLAYGLVMSPEGKISSRRGAEAADDIMTEINNLAEAEIKKREPDLPEEQVRERAEIIGLGALKFFLLKITPRQFITYNPQEAVSFEGNTGPYIQYAHARIASILEEETPVAARKIKFDLLSSPEEKALVIKLMQYPGVLSDSAKNYNPSLLANHLFALAQNFNSFYHKHQVLKAQDEETKHARLFLIKAVQLVLAGGLSLLGIGAPDRM